MNRHISQTHADIALKVLVAARDPSVAAPAELRTAAAAPELLEALRALVEAPMFEDLAPHLDRARAAIARAEGAP